MNHYYWTVLTLPDPIARRVGLAYRDNHRLLANIPNVPLELLDLPTLTRTLTDHWYPAQDGTGTTIDSFTSWLVLAQRPEPELIAELCRADTFIGAVERIAANWKLSLADQERLCDQALRNQQNASQLNLVKTGFLTTRNKIRLLSQIPETWTTATAEWLAESGWDDQSMYEALTGLGCHHQHDRNAGSLLTARETVLAAKLGHVVTYRPGVADQIFDAGQTNRDGWCACPDPEQGGLFMSAVRSVTGPDRQIAAASWLVDVANQWHTETKNQTRNQTPDPTTDTQHTTEQPYRSERYDMSAKRAADTMRYLCQRPELDRTARSILDTYLLERLGEERGKGLGSGHPLEGRVLRTDPDINQYLDLVNWKTCPPATIAETVANPHASRKLLQRINNMWKPRSDRDGVIPDVGWWRQYKTRMNDARYDRTPNPALQPCYLDDTMFPAEGLPEPNPDRPAEPAPPPIREVAEVTVGRLTIHMDNSDRRPYGRHPDITAYLWELLGTGDDTETWHRWETLVSFLRDASPARTLSQAADTVLAITGTRPANTPTCSKQAGT